MSSVDISDVLGRDVSRETQERLEEFAGLVQKWSPRINLVSKSTLDDIWTRHIVDSSQIVCCVDGLDMKSWSDLGSGGGFPGIVASALCLQIAPDCKFDLVESDLRKVAFLRTAIRELGLGSTTKVHTKRIEEMNSLGSDILSARALSGLPRLLEFSQLHLNASGTALFMKGRQYQSELTEARQTWLFDCQEIQSITDPESMILKIENIRSA